MAGCAPGNRTPRTFKHAAHERRGLAAFRSPFFRGKTERSGCLPLVSLVTRRPNEGGMPHRKNGKPVTSSFSGFTKNFSGIASMEDARPEFSQKIFVAVCRS